MPADQRARLRRLHLRRTDHQHDGGRKRNDDQRSVRFEQDPLWRRWSARRQRPQRLPPGHCGDRCGGLHRPPPAANPVSCRALPNEKGGRSLCRPFGRERMTYFRLVIAVRSAESLTMPAAPHQFEPKPPGLIEVTFVVPEALKALVKALQLPLFRSVSE